MFLWVVYSMKGGYVVIPPIWFSTAEFVAASLLSSDVWKSPGWSILPHCHFRKTMSSMAVCCLLTQVDFSVTIPSDSYTYMLNCNISSQKLIFWVSFQTTNLRLVLYFSLEVPFLCSKKWGLYSRRQDYRSSVLSECWAHVYKGDSNSCPTL